MSAELQAEIDRLKAENATLKADHAKLTKDVESLNADLKETRHEARDRRHEAKTLAEQLAAAAKERDDFKSKSEADPEGLRKQLAETANVVRGMKHERAFEKVAKGLKVNDPARLADLVKLAGYQPEGDEPDEAKIALTFQEALKGRAYLIDPAPTPAPGGAPPAPGGASGATTTGPGGKPGPGSDRGQSVSSPSSSPAKSIPGKVG